MSEAVQTKQRICKKCLLRDLAAKDQKNIKRYLDAIKPQDHAEEEIYEARLAVCRECEKLIDATCQACGCYVELRAAIRHGRCPYKKWNGNK